MITPEPWRAYWEHRNGLKPEGFSIWNDDGIRVCESRTSDPDTSPPAVRRSDMELLVRSPALLRLLKAFFDGSPTEAERQEARDHILDLERIFNWDPEAEALRYEEACNPDLTPEIPGSLRQP